MSPGNHSVFFPHHFLHDLLRELKRNGSPCYPSPDWRVALAIAEREDFYRHIGSVNARADPHPVLLVSYIPDVNPRRLILNGSIQVIREPSEDSRDRERRLCRQYKKTHQARIQTEQRIYFLEHREEINAIRRKAYRRNRAERSAQAHAYYQRNRERLKEKARTRRAAARAALTAA